MVVPKYIKAYEGILTQAELDVTEQELGQFHDSIKGLDRLPRPVIRALGSVMSENAKESAIAGGVKTSDKKAHDYSALVGDVFDKAAHKDHYEAKLNYQQFRLEGDSLKRLKSAQDLSNLFPRGRMREWPTLVLVSNSNLTSPQAFFDNFQAAQELIPALSGGTINAVTIAGAYFSQRHFNANALDTFRRYRELGARPESRDRVSPAAEIQAYQLLDLILERDAGGAVMVDGNKPIIRIDADAIMSHVIGYGYSAAHMTNKDAFRLLRDILTAGDVKVQVIEHGEIVIRDACAADAAKLFKDARLIGVGGMDRMDIAPEKGMPREVNFISPQDLSHAINGFKFLKSPNIIKINPVETGSPPTVTLGGHGQGAYISAILDHANFHQREEACERLVPHWRSR